MIKSKKKAIVTGGTSGIGLETAKLLATKGYEVAITGRSKEKWQADRQAIDPLPDFKFIELNQSLISGWTKNRDKDLQTFEQQLNILDEFASEGLDVLVLNAGVAKYLPIEEETISHYQEMMSVNVDTPYFIVQKLIKRLDKEEIEKNSNIVVISSIITDNPLPNSSVYAMTKAALNTMARSLARELTPRKISVNIVSPGPVDTPLVDKLGVPEDQREGFISEFAKLIPLKRFATPKEIAYAVWAFIKMDFTTGATLTLDGGKSISDGVVHD